MRNSLVEGSITEEEFLILYEEYQSEEKGYKLKLASFQNCFYFSKPTPFELNKSFLNKNTDGYNHHC